MEPALHAEMRELRFARTERQVGGVYFEGTREDVWRANLWLRTAVRVLERVARFQSADEDSLYAGAREVAWEELLSPGGTLAVTAHARDSQLFHTGFLAQLVKDAIVDRIRDRTGARPSVDKDDPELGVRVHLVRDRCTLLLDTTGPSLHKRGWRRYQGRAPLAETLAASILVLSGWDRRSPLIDPFCGSGTFLVEAASLAAGRAPGALRERFAFERWPRHDAKRFAREQADARAERPLPKKLQLVGSDHDPERLEGARENLAAAGFADAVHLQQQDAADFRPRPGWNGWIVTNPPYGERIGDASSLRPLYASFGQRLASDAAGYHLALLTSTGMLADALGLNDLERVRVRNGALECELVVGELRFR
ncbi:MAG: THUMP domain-containing protein [Planctomycetota bacterium]